MAWRIGILALAVLTSGCGGSSDSPTAPTPTVTLTDGNYQLAVYSSTLSCLMVTYSNGATPTSAVQVPVWVDQDGDHWLVNARDDASGSIAITLARNGPGVSGMASGTLTSPGVSVTLSQHQLSGTANGAAEGVVGNVAGSVSYASAGGSAFCSTNLWSLTRQ
jgi:hypothetical protein